MIEDGWKCGKARWKERARGREESLGSCILMFVSSRWSPPSSSPSSSSSSLRLSSFSILVSWTLYPSCSLQPIYLPTQLSLARLCEANALIFLHAHAVSVEVKWLDRELGVLRECAWPSD